MNLESKVTWTEWYPSGEESVAGAAQTLLEKIVERQPRRRLPPYRAFLAILRRGKLGGGMGGGLEWSGAGVELSELDYDRLRQHLPASQQVDDCPASTVEEWVAWCGERDYGVSYVDHLHLLEELRRAEVADEACSDEATQKAYSDAMANYAAFISAALRPA